MVIDDISESDTELNCDLQYAEMEVLETHKKTIELCVHFHKLAVDYYNGTKVEGWDRYDYVKKWEDLLREMIQNQKETLHKTVEFSSLLNSKSS